MDAPAVAADVEGGGADELAGAEAPVQAVPGDHERVPAARRLRRARRRCRAHWTLRQRHRSCWRSSRRIRGGGELGFPCLSRRFNPAG